jgi:hypothetical protein
MGILYAFQFPCLELRDADVAQLVEQPIRNRQVSGSSPLVGSILTPSKWLVYRFGHCARDLIYCPITVPKSVSSHFCLEFTHCCDHILSLRLDVIAECDVNVRVAKDRLNHLVGNSESIKVCAQSASCCMPPMPPWSPKLCSCSRQFRQDRTRSSFHLQVAINPPLLLVPTIKPSFGLIPKTLVGDPFGSMILLNVLFS